MRLAKLSFYIFLLVLFLAPLLGGAPVGPDYALAAWGGDSMSGILRLLTLATAVLVAALTEREGAKASPLAIIARLGVFGAAGWVSISLLTHSKFFTSQVYAFAMIPEALNWLTFAVVFALAARFTAEDKNNLSKMAIALLAGGVICALVGVMAYSAVPGAERAQHRETATFFSPNYAAGFVALILPLAVALFLSVERLLASVASGVCVFLLFALLMTTGSRAGLALALVGLVIAFALALVRKAAVPWKKVGVVAVLIALSGFAFLAPMRGRVAASEGGTATATTAVSSGDHSGDFRKETWRGTLAMASDNPLLGAGPGTFPYTYSPYARVAWTGQAHSSYLQLAGESGFPALVLALVGIAGGIVAGLNHKKELPVANALLVPAAVGGVIASVGRSVFDSEWALLAIGIPFFALLGALVGNNMASATDDAKKLSPLSRGIASLFLALALVYAWIVRTGQSERDALILQNQKQSGSVAAAAKEAASCIIPPDPQLYALGGDYATAAFLSPSGKRLFQLARSFEAQADEDRAVQEFQKAAEADPNNLQTRKALAEAQAKIGDTGGAILTYTDMVQIAEGPAGKIRAIPELTDTLPAFAYTALAEDAMQRGNAAEAESNFAKAQQIVEDYSRTPPIYQLSEIATLGANTNTRRAEVRALYIDRIIPGRRAALKRLGKPLGIEVASETMAETVSRLDAFVSPSRATP